MRDIGHIGVVWFGVQGAALVCTVKTCCCAQGSAGGSLLTALTGRTLVMKQHRPLSVAGCSTL
jgi:hypothetical protein